MLRIQVWFAWDLSYQCFDTVQSLRWLENTRITGSSLLKKVEKKEKEKLWNAAKIAFIKYQDRREKYLPWGQAQPSKMKKKREHYRRRPEDLGPDSGKSRRKRLVRKMKLRDQLAKIT